jgi:hypothetical protein
MGKLKRTGFKNCIEKQEQLSKNAAMRNITKILFFLKTVCSKM